MYNQNSYFFELRQNTDFSKGKCNLALTSEDRTQTSVKVNVI